MRAVLSVRELVKEFPGNPPLKAVDQVSFDLGEGEILALLGSNGAGKTTTIQLLLGILSHTRGSIFYFGSDFHQFRESCLEKIGFASAYVHLPGNLTVEQNFEVFGRLYGLDRATIRERTIPLLDRLGISEKKRARTATLSAGQLTRVALIKAFMVRPRLILLDEPTASLDPDVAKEVHSFLLEQRDSKGVSILFTSHKMDEVAHLSDRILFLKKGKVVADNSPEQLINDGVDSLLTLGVVDRIDEMIAWVERRDFPYRRDQHRIEVEIMGSMIPRFLSDLAHEGFGYNSIRIDPPKLEAYFLKMVR